MSGGPTDAVYSASHEDVWRDLFQAKFERSLNRVTGAGVGSERGRAILAAGQSVFEELLGLMQRAAEVQQSQLIRDLAAAHISLEAFTTQLAVLSRMNQDASRSKRGRVLKPALAAVSAFLLGIPVGSGESVGSTITQQVLRSPEVSARLGVADLQAACMALDGVLLNGGVYSTDRRAPSEVQLPLDAQLDDEGLSEGEDLFDDDPWANLQDNEGNYVLPDADPIEGGQWRDNGFTPEEAEEWRGQGFASPDDARLWGETGFEASEPEGWIRHGFSTAGEAYEWHEAGFSPTDANEWASFDVDPEAAINWADREFLPADAELWRHGIRNPWEADLWRDEQFLPQEAADWDRLGFHAEDASSWRDAQFASSDAHHWRSQGFEAADAAEWRASAFTPTAAKRWVEKGLTVDQAARVD
jgi:hypothetical protein